MSTNTTTRTNLMQAAIDGDLHQVLLHTHQSGEWEYYSDYRYTALDYAIHFKHWDCAYEIEAYEDINRKIYHGATRLHREVRCLNTRFIEWLLRLGANINATSGTLPTTRNAKYSAKEVSPHGLGDTPLHTAVEVEDYDMAMLLMKNNADPNIQNRDGDTPYHMILRHRAFLIPQKISVFYEQSGYGECCRERRIERYYKEKKLNELIDIFRVSGANPGIKNNEGKFPLV